MHQEGLIDEASQNTMAAGPVKTKKDIFAKLSNREIEFYREVFEKIDEDGSGQIDEDELKIREGLAAAAERDALQNKKASLENEVQSLRQEYADFEQKEDKKNKAALP